MLVEKVTPRQIFEVLRDQASVTSWLGKNLQSKIVLSESPDKVYSTIHKGGVFPLKNREVIHKHLTQADEANHIYVVSDSSLGLENVTIHVFLITGIDFEQTKFKIRESLLISFRTGHSWRSFQ